MDAGFGWLRAVGGHVSGKHVPAGLNLWTLSPWAFANPSSHPPSNPCVVASVRGARLLQGGDVGGTLSQRCARGTSQPHRDQELRPGDRWVFGSKTERTTEREANGLK